MTAGPVTVRESAFRRGGGPFLYLADTAWSGLTNPSDAEWLAYLDLRREQGFTALQINVLPQWDRTILLGSPDPFERGPDGRIRWESWDEEYLVAARRRVAQAVARGLVPALVVLWSNYVPGTWASAIRDTDVMPLERVGTHARRLARAFGDLDPIWIVGGDTDLDTPEAVEHYRTASDVLRAECPSALQALHLRRGYAQVPAVLAERVQVLLFQSGHNRDGQAEAHRLGPLLRQAHPGLAILNGEPCYEGMGYSRRQYGRFGRREVRAAVWNSLLSGADAGFAYGAHGVWNWHVRGHAPDPALGEGFDESLPWTDALHAPGAWDVGVIRHLLETVVVPPLRPAQDLVLLPDHPGVRAASTADGSVVLYVPVATRVTLDPALVNPEATVYDLAGGRIARLEPEVGDGHTTVPLHRFDQDVLIRVRSRA